ncbi:unnamed protein product [Mytilus edulis]|uniref:Uncharacterized protein n=1 Tax=Mytilus edulis TaxID=6550 RepID=A0A8S3TXN6_MYTED|nr:unnamed protein product [Mytilus edulis]
MKWVSGRASEWERVGEWERVENDVIRDKYQIFIDIKEKLKVNYIGIADEDDEQFSSLITENMSTKDEAKTSEESISTSTAALIQAQTLVKSNLPVSVTLRKQFNINIPPTNHMEMMSCIKIGNKLIFTDLYNKRLNICNSDDTTINHIPVPYDSWFLTEVDSNTVSVSCIGKIIPIIDISAGSITDAIRTNHPCLGIAYNDNNLYVVIEYRNIQVMDLTGKQIRTIPLPADNIIDITVDRDRLVCIESVSIYCCSLDGKLIWKFENDKYHSLSGVTTDDDGNVYVINDKNHSVVVVCDNGKHYREILSESNGLNRPCGIYFDKQENVLLVCNYRGGEAFLFDVQKNNI